MKNKEKDILYCGVNAEKISKATPTINAPAFVEFVRMIKTRYLIHLRKDVQKLPKPWTNNPIMQQYKFTNVRREHDRETRWLIEHITSNPDLSYEDKILNCILFRIFNKHQTSEIIEQPILFDEFHKNPNRYKESLKAAKDSGQKLFTNAFFTTGARQGIQVHLRSVNISSDFSGNDVMLFMDCLYRDNIVEKIKQAEDQAEVFAIITSYMGIGPFLGYQMFVDFTYISEFPFSENEFTIAGPGCKNGLNILFKDRDRLTYEECLFWLRDNWDDLIKNQDLKWNPDKLFNDLPEYDRCMNVMSLENCFCEFSKYMRALTGAGRPKIKYKGV